MTDENTEKHVVRTAERIRVIEVNGVPVASVAGLSLVNGRLVNLMEDWRPCLT